MILSIPIHLNIFLLQVFVLGNIKLPSTRFAHNLANAYASKAKYNRDHQLLDEIRHNAIYDVLCLRASWKDKFTVACKYAYSPLVFAMLI